MSRAVLLTAAFAAISTGALAADVRSRPVVAAEAPAVVVELSDWRSRYCPSFGPNDFGNFAGALPRYPNNAFPDYHGECAVWGPYEATGTAYW